MGLPPKPNQLTPLPNKPKPVDPPFSEISIDSLIDNCLLILHREVKNLLMLSVNGKLEATDARDLRDHLKLLFELKSRESGVLSGLTDEEIKARARMALDGDN